MPSSWQVVRDLLTGNLLRGDSGGVCSVIGYRGDNTGSGSSYASY